MRAAEGDILWGSTVSTTPQRILFSIAILFVAAATLGSAQAANVYFSWSGWAEQFTDPNSGLTVLNSLLVPVGGNREGMGTAYTAVASDVGYIESNPAASSQLTITEVSLSHREWIADVSLDSLVYTIRIKDLGLGVAGKFVPIAFTGYDSYGNDEGGSYITETVIIANASYNLWNNYRNNLVFDGLALGANLKVAYRGVPVALAQGQSGLGVMLDLGALTRFNFLKTYRSRAKNFSAGATIRNLGPNVRGEPLPTMLSLGVAYAVVRPVLLSFDLNVPISFQPDVYPAERINVAAGMDVTVADFLSIQAGLWMRGANPRVTIGATVDLSRTALVVNSSIDQSGVHFSLEAKVNLGDLGRGARQARIDDLFARSIKAYAAGDYESAASLSEEVLSIRPDHVHAELVLKLARDSLTTQSEIRRKQAEAAGLLKRAAGIGGTEAAAGGTVKTPGDEGLDN